MTHKDVDAFTKGTSPYDVFHINSNLSLWWFATGPPSPLFSAEFVKNVNQLWPASTHSPCHIGRGRCVFSVRLWCVAQVFWTVSVFFTARWGKADRPVKPTSSSELGGDHCVYPSVCLVWVSDVRWKKGWLLPPSVPTLNVYGGRKEDRARKKKRESEARGGHMAWVPYSACQFSAHFSGLTESPLKKNTSLQLEVKLMTTNTKQQKKNDAFSHEDGQRSYEWRRQLGSNQCRQWKVFQDWQKDT